MDFIFFVSLPQTSPCLWPLSVSQHKGADLVLLLCSFSPSITETSNAPAALGPYGNKNPPSSLRRVIALGWHVSFVLAQAIKVNGMVYTSGQIPINPATGKSSMCKNDSYWREVYRWDCWRRNHRTNQPKFGQYWCCAQGLWQLCRIGDQDHCFLKGHEWLCGYERSLRQGKKGSEN